MRGGRATTCWSKPGKGISDMDDAKRMDRREAIKWMLTATVTLSLLRSRSYGAATDISGYGRDPDLMRVYKPGNLWPLTLTPEQHRTVSALCDVILPADERSPSASELKVPDFIDEWISAPYERQRQDRNLLLTGFLWLEAESKKRYRQGFAALSERQQHSICDDICSAAKARPKFARAAGFFKIFRDLAMSGYYTTPEGMKDLQYLGNVPLVKFDGPPAEVLNYLKIT